MGRSRKRKPSRWRRWLQTFGISSPFVFVLVLLNYLGIQLPFLGNTNNQHEAQRVQAWLNRILPKVQAQQPLPTANPANQVDQTDADGYFDPFAPLTPTEPGPNTARHSNPGWAGTNAEPPPAVYGPPVPSNYQPPLRPVDHIGTRSRPNPVDLSPFTR